MEKLQVSQLRDVLRQYNKKVKVSGINKMKKNELISKIKQLFKEKHDKKNYQHIFVSKSVKVNLTIIKKHKMTKGEKKKEANKTKKIVKKVVKAVEKKLKKVVGKANGDKEDLGAKIKDEFEKAIEEAEEENRRMREEVVVERRKMRTTSLRGKKQLKLAVLKDVEERELIPIELTKKGKFKKKVTEEGKRNKRDLNKLLKKLKNNTKLTTKDLKKLEEIRKREEEFEKLL